MKRIITVLAAVLLMTNVFAQAPEKMSYQAVIRNSSDQLVTNTQIGMEINIRQGSASGSVVYTETQTPTTNANGLVSIEIGREAGFSSIDWGSDSYFIETKTAIVAPFTTYTITGTSQLLSVPYALHAKSAEIVSGGITESDPVFTDWDKTTGIIITESQISDLQEYLMVESDPTFTIWDKDYADLTNTPTTITTAQANAINANTEKDTTGIYHANRTALDLVSGTNTGDQDLSALATKTALGDSIASVRSQIPDVSGFLTGETQDLDAVLTQNNSAGNKNIINLANPVNSQDAATKAYVDTLVSSFIFDLLIDLGDTEKLLNAGYTVKQLLDGGHLVSDLYAAGASVVDLLAAGASVADLVAAGAQNEADYIGLMYEGGMIFYVDVTNDGTGTGIGTGLVCALSDQSTSAEWGCLFYAITGADSSSIGAGSQNTIDIEADCATAGTAADICANLSLNGYTDWFLPSKDELNLMWLILADSNGDGINTEPSDPNNLGGFASAFYWSSTENDMDLVWGQSFGNGYQDLDFKHQTNYVRAVRAF